MKTEFNLYGQKVQVTENTIDRVVRYFNPVRGQQRFAARAKLAIGMQAASYRGADRGRRSMRGWTYTNFDADSDTLLELDDMRGASRDLVRNAPLARGAVLGTVTAVVGTGLKLQARPDRRVLGMPDEEADELEQRLEAEFALWAESVECDIARTKDFFGLQELAFLSTLENGDCFALMPMIARAGSPYSLKVQLIEADRVSNPEHKTDDKGLAGGVERDAQGAPTAYWITREHPGSTRKTLRKDDWVRVPAFGVTTGRRNALHLYRQYRIGQSRGIPFLAPVIEPLKQLDRYSEAEIMAAVVAGMFTVFVKTQGGGELAPVVPTSETGASTGDEDIRLANGAVVGLKPGESIDAANPGRPNANFDPFVTAILRQIGVALEIPFEVLVKHFTSSYSAARAAFLEAWRFYMSRRAWLARTFCQPLYELWFEEAVALGRIDAPGFFDDPLIRKAYLAAEWVGPARGMIQEKSEVDAAKQRVDMGISTLSEETAQLTGGDWERKHAQRAKEKRMRVESGLEPGLFAAPGSPGDGEEPEEGPEPEPEPDENGDFDSPLRRTT